MKLRGAFAPRGHHLDHVPNECYLWHGTKPDVAPLIVHEGFDERVCAAGFVRGRAILRHELVKERPILHARFIRYVHEFLATGGAR